MVLASDLGLGYILLPMASSTNHSLSTYLYEKQHQPKITQFGLEKAILSIYKHLQERSDAGWPVPGFRSWRLLWLQVLSPRKMKMKRELKFRQEALTVKSNSVQTKIAPSFFSNVLDQRVFTQEREFITFKY